MNATQTMETVNTHVPTHQGHEYVAAGLGSDRQVMAHLVKVSSDVIITAVASNYIGIAIMIYCYNTAFL